MVGETRCLSLNKQKDSDFTKIIILMYMIVSLGSNTAFVCLTMLDVFTSTLISIVIVSEQYPKSLLKQQQQTIQILA